MYKAPIPNDRGFPAITIKGALKKKLEGLKKPGESFSDLLERLMQAAGY